MLAPRSPRSAWLFLLLAAAPSAWLGSVQARTPLDVENRALKTIAGPDADNMARRERAFGRDRVLLAGFHAVVPAAGIAAADDRGLEALARALRTCPGVGQVDAVPPPSPDLRLLLVSLAGEVAPAVSGIDRCLHDRCPPGLAVEVSGVPMAELAIAEAVTQEQRWTVPAVALVLLLLLLGVYRHLGVALAALVPAAFGITWTGGAYALLGHRLGPVSCLLQPVLLTVGVACSVHFVDGFLRRRQGQHQAVASALARTARDLVVPATLACATTVVGFLVNAFSPIPAVAALATYAALGVALTSAAAFWLVPCALTAWTSPRAPSRTRRLARGATARACRSLVGWTGRHAFAITTAAAALLLWAASECRRLQVDNDPLRVLPAEHSLRRETEGLAARLGGVELFDLLVPAGSAAADPTELRLLAASLSLQPGVAGLAGPPRIASTGDVLLSAVLPRSGSTEREALFDRVAGDLDLRGRSEVAVTGANVQIARDSNRLVRAQLVSFGVTLLALWLVMAWGLRSWRLGLLGLIPNVLTCLLVYGAMAWVGRPISVATALIGSVMLGLVVDTTIHLLARFGRARARGARAAPAVASALLRTGRAASVTTLVLGAGFGVAALGRLETTIEFGLLAALTVVVAFAVAALLLPALLLLRRERPA